ncbi:24744_t:CDS:2 [Cetraspora pellucida]|uniref:Protein PNS1 n=1 Tax=Cetraspora pellucida TaxID=1433469 RepID=A0A9N9J4G1_9GLOM|nr:24744_t:CDS:2 [Cetraspora pellucida]
MSQYFHHMPEPIHYPPPPPTPPNSTYPYTHTGLGKTSTYYNDNERQSYEPQHASYMTPQASYPQPPSFEEAVNSGSDSAHIKFNQRPKYQDLWAAVLFMLNLLAFIVISAVSLSNYAIIQRQARTPVESVTLNWSTIWLLMFCVGIGFVLSTAAYQVWYPAACKQTHRTPASNPNCHDGQFIVIVIFLLFTYYWVSQVIQTFIHVTTSGVFASYYFLEGTPQGVSSLPTLKSAKRAATTSFGSICFGSLLVAILQVIRELLRSLAQDTDNPLGAFCAACAAALVGYIDALLEYFNFYAYTQVAIYGKSFCDAVNMSWKIIVADEAETYFLMFGLGFGIKLLTAKDTWTMIQDRGVEAVINDNLIGTVIIMGIALLYFIYNIQSMLSPNAKK